MPSTADKNTASLRTPIQAKFTASWRAIALPLSEAFLSESTQRLGKQVLPTAADPDATIPSSLRVFEIYTVDGKVVKRVSRLLKPLRGQKGGLLGAKRSWPCTCNPVCPAVAMGLLLADGEVNDASLIPALLPQMKSVLPRSASGHPRQPILRPDARRPDCGARDDHFVVRAHPRVHFHTGCESRASQRPLRCTVAWLNAVATGARTGAGWEHRAARRVNTCDASRCSVA